METDFFFLFPDKFRYLNVGSRVSTFFKVFHFPLTVGKIYVVSVEVGQTFIKLSTERGTCTFVNKSSVVDTCK